MPLILERCGNLTDGSSTLCSDLRSFFVSPLSAISTEWKPILVILNIGRFLLSE